MNDEEIKYGVWIIIFVLFIQTVCYFVVIGHICDWDYDYWIFATLSLLVRAADFMFFVCAHIDLSKRYESKRYTNLQRFLVWFFISVISIAIVTCTVSLGHTRQLTTHVLVSTTSFAGLTIMAVAHAIYGIFNSLRIASERICEIMLTLV
jgi:hypothetical protein